MSKLENYLAGERARLNGNLDEALASYRAALKKDPDDWKIRENVAETLYAKEDLRGCLKELFNAAHRLIWQKQYEEATKMLQKMVRLDPEKEIPFTRGVDQCLQEIAAELNSDSEELPVDGDWKSTKEFLSSLVLNDSTSEFRVSEEELQSSTPPVPPSRLLLLDISQGPSVTLAKKEYLIGRSKDCHLRFRQSMVSRRHCRIVEIDGHFFLQNWESRNGTILNGKVVEQAELQAGDIMQFGKTGPTAKVAFQPAP